MEESTAIEELLGRRMDEIAGRFFNGDIAGLLDRAGGLDLDMEEPASFPLRMDTTQSVHAMAAEEPATADDLPGFINAVDTARTASAGRKNPFDELLKAATQLLNAADEPEPQGTATGLTSSVTLPDRLLSAIDAATKTSMPVSETESDAQDDSESTRVA